ncbi:MAG: hypothetical protein U0L15_02390 [Oscillospiraceae bacterium]|jgi:hypothetical protein|nr:hypothetical protein [Oscillospiraceae bacterium]
MEEKNLTPEEETPPVRIEDQSAKSLWQQTKESWYDKVNLTVKQLDIIIGCCIAALILTFIAIALDAIGVF